MNQKTIMPFASPLYVMLKPVGSLCNLDCDYCYYLEKSNLYKEIPKQVMSETLLEKFTEEYINSQTMNQVLFTWHGGETLMRPLSFYKKAMEFQKKYARGRVIDNCIQTNGTMLTDEWCAFFRENNWLVSVSIDGPQEFNGDVYSCDHYVFPEYKLGNIYNKSLMEMLYSEKQLEFGDAKSRSLPTLCKECEYLFACNGECPKNRFASTKNGEPGLNYLCKGFYQFYHHVAPYMDFMKKELLNKRPPANVMDWINARN